MACPPALCGQHCFAGPEHGETAALNHEQEPSPASGRNEARSHVKHSVFIAKIGFFSVASIHKVFSPYIYAVNRLSAAVCTGLKLPHGLAPPRVCSPQWTPPTLPLRGCGMSRERQRGVHSHAHGQRVRLGQGLSPFTWGWHQLREHPPQPRVKETLPAAHTTLQHHAGIGLQSSHGGKHIHVTLTQKPPSFLQPLC